VTTKHYTVESVRAPPSLPVFSKATSNKLQQQKLSRYLISCQRSESGNYYFSSAKKTARWPFVRWPFVRVHLLLYIDDQFDFYAIYKNYFGIHVSDNFSVYYSDTFSRSFSVELPVTIFYHNRFLGRTPDTHERRVKSRLNAYKLRYCSWRPPTVYRGSEWADIAPLPCYVNRCINAIDIFRVAGRSIESASHVTFARQPHRLWTPVLFMHCQAKIMIFYAMRIWRQRGTSLANYTPRLWKQPFTCISYGRCSKIVA